jgi:hypothetical protein
MQATLCRIVPVRLEIYYWTREKIVQHPILCDFTQVEALRKSAKFIYPLARIVGKAIIIL